jgi:hypothetical protein
LNAQFPARLISRFNSFRTQFLESSGRGRFPATTRLPHVGLGLLCILELSIPRPPDQGQPAPNCPAPSATSPYVPRSLTTTSPPSSRSLPRTPPRPLTNPTPPTRTNPFATPRHRIATTDIQPFREPASNHPRPARPSHGDCATAQHAPRAPLHGVRDSSALCLKYIGGLGNSQPFDLNKQSAPPDLDGNGSLGARRGFIGNIRQGSGAAQQEPTGWCQIAQTADSKSMGGHGGWDMGVGDLAYADGAWEAHPTQSINLPSDTEPGPAPHLCVPF